MKTLIYLRIQRGPCSSKSAILKIFSKCPKASALSSERDLNGYAEGCAGRPGHGKGLREVYQEGKRDSCSLHAASFPAIRKGPGVAPIKTTGDCACQCDSGKLVSLFIVEADRVLPRGSRSLTSLL